VISGFISSLHVEGGLFDSSFSSSEQRTVYVYDLRYVESMSTQDAYEHEHFVAALQVIKNCQICCQNEEWKSRREFLTSSLLLWKKFFRVSLTVNNHCCIFSPQQTM
jgi:hypothetical protein